MYRVPGFNREAINPFDFWGSTVPMKPERLGTLVCIKPPWMQSVFALLRQYLRAPHEESIYGHAKDLNGPLQSYLIVATFDMSSRAQFLRLGDATSAVFSEQSILGSPRKTSAIGENTWDLIISEIALNRPMFFAAIRELIVSKIPPKWRRRVSKIEPGSPCQRLPRSEC